MKLGPTWANYRARKTCNFLTEAIDVCGNKLLQHGCHSEEEVTTMKDTQLSRVLENIGQSVADFDSCKCPAAKAHIDRMRASALSLPSPEKSITGPWNTSGIACKISTSRT